MSLDDQHGEIHISLQHCGNNIRIDQHTAHMDFVQCGELRWGQKHVLYNLLSLPDMHLTASLGFSLQDIMYNMHALATITWDWWSPAKPAGIWGRCAKGTPAGLLRLAFSRLRRWVVLPLPCWAARVALAKSTNPSLTAAYSNKQAPWQKLPSALEYRRAVIGECAVW